VKFESVEPSSKLSVDSKRKFPAEMVMKRIGAEMTIAGVHHSGCPKWTVLDRVPVNRIAIEPDLFQMRNPEERQTTHLMKTLSIYGELDLVTVIWDGQAGDPR
jgi:hypothetical protein